MAALRETAVREIRARRLLASRVLAGRVGQVGNSSNVTSSSDPRLLERLIPHLRTAAESAPEGEPRWSCLCYLANAIDMGGRPDASLPFYEQAAAQARAAAQAGGDGSRQAWSDVAWITANWADALRKTRNLPAARERHVESAGIGAVASWTRTFC